MTAAGAAFLCFRMISFSKRDNASLRRLFTQDMDANDGSGSCILILSTQNTVPPVFISWFSAVSAKLTPLFEGSGKTSDVTFTVSPKEEAKRLISFPTISLRSMVTGVFLKYFPSLKSILSKVALASFIWVSEISLYTLSPLDTLPFISPITILSFFWRI